MEMLKNLNKYCEYHREYESNDFELRNDIWRCPKVCHPDGTIQCYHCDIIIENFIMRWKLESLRKEFDQFQEHFNKTHKQSKKKITRLWNKLKS